MAPPRPSPAANLLREYGESTRSIPSPRAGEASGTSGSAAVEGFLGGSDASGDCSLAGWDLMLGSIASFYAVVVPYTKVEESFYVQ
ncbi:hypothetical protein ABZP36_007060 [Zizania latifolia]